MSSNSAATTARTVAASAKRSEKKVVMKELEKKLKGRQTPLNESPKSSKKSLTVKQVINENMLAARARWLTQNKDKDEEIEMNASMSCGGGGSGSEESDIEDTRERRLAMSHEPSKTFRLDDNKDIEPQKTRGFSNSVPNASISKTLQTSPLPTNNSGVILSSKTSKPTYLASGDKLYRGGKQSSDGTKKQSSVSSTSSAVKKLFGFKPKKKRKRTRKMTRIAPTRVGSVKGEGGAKKKGDETEKITMGKSKSDSSLVVQKVRAFTSSVEEEPTLAPSHGYQNVFDNPQFAKYTQQHQQKRESRSNTSSPSDNATLLQAKKPKPLPRPSMSGSTMGRYSAESDQEPGLESLPTTSLSVSSLVVNSPTSAYTDSLTCSLSENLTKGVEIAGPKYMYGSDNSLGGNNSERSGCHSRSGSFEPKERLGKTVSYNPDSMALLWRETSQKKKELRRGICSDGDQNEFDLDDDYIEMNSISLLKETTSSSVSTDTNRESAYYLEILPNLQELATKKHSMPIKSQSKIGNFSGKSKESIKPHKENTVPSISINSTRNVNTLVYDEASPQEGHAEGSKSTLSATPPKCSPVASKSDNQELLKASRRNFQYTPVMVEGGKQRQQSDPKKIRYQAVTLGNKNEKLKVTEGEEKELDERAKTVTAGQREGKKDSLKIDSTDSHPKVKHHPLVNLSSGARRSPMRSVGAEHSDYVNRDSLVMMENSTHLHTTMFSTVDPVTGKIQWHEYVEMDEDEIDRLATSIGMVKSAPIIPNKLEALLNFKSKEQPHQDVSERETEDLELSCDSTGSVSSDCKYILNLNEPPTVPLRPENLDELAYQLELQSSDDYSYAFTPGMGARWKINGGKICTKLPTSKTNSTCPVTIVENMLDGSKECVAVAPQAKTSISVSKSLQLDAERKMPPSLPPRTESLLREQELVKGLSKKKPSSQLSLLPILVKTKEKHKTKSYIPAKSSSNLATDVSKLLGQGTVNHIKEDAQARDNQLRMRNTPSKPIPYKEHQKKRLQGHKATPTLLSSPDSPVKQEMAETKSTSTAHGKLARQRSRLASRERVCNHKPSSQQKEELEKASLRAPAGQTNLVRESVRDKQKVSKRSGFDLGDSLNRESMALLLQNQDAITKELFASRTEPEHCAEANESALEINETETSQKVRDLSHILVELRYLLKSSDFSEQDILLAIDSHLKLTHKPGNGDEEGNENEESEEEYDSNEEEEEWMSGDEPESDIEAANIPEQTCSADCPFYINFQGGDEELESEPTNKLADTNDEEQKIEKALQVLSSESCDEADGNVSYYINSELSTRVKTELTEDKRHCYSSNIETNLDRAVRSPRTPVPSSKASEREVSPSSAAPVNHNSYTSSQSSSFSDGHRERSMTAVSYSSQTQNQRQKTSPRSNRSHSNPNVELADAVVAASASSFQSSISATKPRLHQRQSYLESRRSEKTFSYCLALQMEDRHLSQAEEIGTYKRLHGVIEEGTSGDGGTSYANKSLQRVNALARKRPKGALISNTGRGTFTSKGGRLTKEGSDITIEIPEGAIPRGNSQKLWFDVVQNVYDPSSKEDASSILLRESSRTMQVESLMKEKKDAQVQLSPMIAIGPSDAILECPLIIRMPHCLSYRNNCWHLQMLGQASNDEDQEWSEIVNTIGLVQLPARPKSTFHNRSTYQMHIDYVQIKTSQLGSFKLVGRPIRNGTYAAKKMVASVYVKAMPEIYCMLIDIFISNAIEDQSYALDQSLISHHYTALLKDMPILCFGDGKDLEVTLSKDSNYAVPLGTKAIPFGQIWRNSKVGSSHVTFEVQESLVQDDRALTLKVEQAGSKLYHEANFLLPDL